jgi:hypothetical protein
LKLTLGGLLVASLVAACGSSPSAGPGGDAGTEDAPLGTPDAGGADTGSALFPSYLKGPGLVFIDGLVTGTTTVSGLQLDDVRVCIRSTADNSFLTTYAVPDQTPMPLASYPGVRLGGGVDLGQFQAQQVTLDIYRAGAIAADSAWASPEARTDYACKKMNCTGGLPCQPHVSLPVTLEAGAMNVIALVDGVGDVTIRQRAFSDVEYQGVPSSLFGTVMDVSGWKSGATISVFYGVFPGSDPSDKELVPALDPQSTHVPMELTNSIKGYEGYGVRFDAASDGGGSQFAQSLDSIAYVSSPAVTPPAFFGVRENFVFALVGNPSDTTSALQNGGRNPLFDGTGLHIVAIPYATPQ